MVEDSRARPDETAPGDVVRRLNAELRRQVANLQAATAELEAFSYSVSHDLRAPLRALDGFARILQQDYMEGLAPEGQEYLQLIRENSQHMSQLIDDLLAFSRLSRHPLTKARVLPARIVGNVLHQLKPQLGGRNITFTVGNLPRAYADPALLRHVYANLLENSIKYTRLRDLAEIEAGFQDLGGQVVYFVKDNGVGFDMRYADRLFGVFHRLHPAEQYEGTGVGLAIVRRIVERHGGSVWAEAEVGRGATFYFTLKGDIDE
jgi:light-regulated signal transduction histidine kinase (bacteriophytochrome)